ncbi:hypothetical protein L3C95_08765 [Chitinophaga filiformis]|uniref:hypothetical protein n=1 Tax=Chitinophaga filiformis TaxID=104663 RepID=UPI001F3BA419|nr:hypothetical protein [Chitinophaga filiformis]MCF6402962.1 hypothetical protein [Chitinophaga filiformis]
MKKNSNPDSSPKSVSSIFTLADAISIDQYGGIANDSSALAKAANVTAFNDMVADVNDGQPMIIPHGNWYFNDALELIQPKNTSAKKFVLYTYGDLTFDGDGFVVEGFFHRLQFYGVLTGTNPSASNATQYDAYQGTGILLRNTQNCYVEVNRLLSFRNAINIAGVNQGVLDGAQYNTVRITGSLRSNRTAILFSVDGSTWCNRNTVEGGQLGGGTSGPAGGTYGIKFERISGTSRPETNTIRDVGLEGVENGIYAEGAVNNDFFLSRVEAPAVTNKFYFREDNTNSLSAPDNKVWLTAAYENYWVTGGLATGTIFYGTLYTTSTSKIGDISFAGVNGKFTCINFNDAFTAFNETTNDVLSFNNLDGNASGRYIIRAKLNGVTRWVPFDPEDVTTSVQSYSVAEGIGMVFMNRTTTPGVVNLPTASSWRRREVGVRNIGTQNITVNGVSTGDKSLIAPGECVIYKSDGGTWWVISLNV